MSNDHMLSPGADTNGDTSCLKCGMTNVEIAMARWPKCKGEASPKPSTDADIAIAIGEDAFRAGFDAAVALGRPHYPADEGLAAEWREQAWSAYTPPDHLTGVL